MLWKLVVAGLTLTLAGCAAQTQLVKETKSGYPEETVVRTTLEEVRSRLFEGCGADGLMVQEAATNQVVCGRTMTGMRAAAMQLLIGNSYSTTPVEKIRFTAYQVGPNVKVTAQGWVETQMAFGQVKTVEMDSNSNRNYIQAMLTRLSSSIGAAAGQTNTMNEPISATPNGVPAPAEATSMQAQAEPTAKPALAKTGEFNYGASRVASKAGCSKDPRVTLMAKGPGFETYSVPCANGDTIAIRCEFGNCRVLR